MHLTCERGIKPVLFCNTINTILGSVYWLLSQNVTLGLKELENTLHHHPKLVCWQTHNCSLTLGMLSFPSFVYNQNRVVIPNPCIKYIHILTIQEQATRTLQKKCKIRKTIYEQMEDLCELCYWEIKKLWLHIWHNTYICMNLKI